MVAESTERRQTMKKSTLKTVAWIMALVLTCAMAAVLSLAVAAEAPEIE